MLPLAQYLPEFDEDQETSFESLAPARRSRKPTFEQPILVAGRAMETEVAPPSIGSPIPEIDDVDEPVGAEAVVSDVVDDAPWPAAEAPKAVEAGSEADLPVDLEMVRAEARQEERAALQAEIEEAVAAARADERERAEADKSAAIEAARAEWAATEGERLGALLSERLDRVETVVRTSLSAVLRPIALNTRRRQSVLELADAVRMLVGDGKALSVRAIGPSDLLAALGDALGTAGDFVTCQSDDTLVDVRIECDQTVIETRLQNWRTALEEALA